MWGISTSIDLKECDPVLIRSENVIKKFVEELVKLIDMKAFGAPQIVHFGEDEKVAGFTLVQMIETSLISAHFANLSKSAYIDIFSCKEYSQAIAASFCQKFFCASHMNYTTIKRG